MGPTVGKAVQAREKLFKHSIDVLADIAVRKPHRHVAAVLVHEISSPILGGDVGVSIDFHDQRFLRAEEIDDAVTDDMLAAKLVAAELRAAETAPKFRFERSCRLPELLRSTDEMRILHVRRTPPLPLP